MPIKLYKVLIKIEINDEKELPAKLIWPMGEVVFFEGLQSQGRKALKEEVVEVRGDVDVFEVLIHWLVALDDVLSSPSKLIGPQLIELALSRFPVMAPFTSNGKQIAASAAATAAAAAAAVPATATCWAATSKDGGKSVPAKQNQSI